MSLFESLLILLTEIGLILQIINMLNDKPKDE
jgi:hypothetical protein